MRQFIYTLREGLAGHAICGAEIGVERGDNAADILHMLDIEYLALVDIWRPFVQEGKPVWDEAICEANYQYVLGRFDDPVEVFRMPSVQAARQVSDELDFVYIDACHQYESVIEDIRTWLPKVRKGGLLAGHDFCDVWPGVVQAVIDSAATYGWKLEHGRNPTESVDDWWVWV